MFASDNKSRHHTATASSAAIKSVCEHYNGTKPSNPVNQIAGNDDDNDRLVVANIDEPSDAHLDNLDVKLFDENPCVDKDKFKSLQKWHLILFSYLKFKRSQNATSNPDVNNQGSEIDDPRYFSAILIARKIEQAAKATSEENYALQMQHLWNFLLRLAQDEDLYQEKANNSGSQAFRMLVDGLVHEMTAAENVSNHENTEDEKLLLGLRNIVAGIAEESTVVIEAAANRMLYRGTKYSLDDIIYYIKTNDGNVSDKESDRYKQLDGDASFKVAVVVHNDFNLQNLKPIKQLFAASAKLSEDQISDDVCHAFQGAFSELNKLKRLRELLQKILMQVANNNSRDLVYLLKTINKINNEIKNSIKLISENEAKYNTALLVMYYQSTDMDFRKRFEKDPSRLMQADGRRALSAKIEESKVALFLLERVATIQGIARETDKEKILEIKSAVASELTASLDSSSSQLMLSSQLLRSSSVGLSDSSGEIKQPQATDDFDRYMNNVVMPNLQAAVKFNYEVVIPDEVLAQLAKVEHAEWLKRILNLFKQSGLNADKSLLERRVAALQLEIEGLKNTIRASEAAKVQVDNNIVASNHANDLLRAALQAKDSEMQALQADVAAGQVAAEDVNADLQRAHAEMAQELAASLAANGVLSAANNAVEVRSAALKDTYDDNVQQLAASQAANAALTAAKSAVETTNTDLQQLNAQLQTENTDLKKVNVKVEIENIKNVFIDFCASYRSVTLRRFEFFHGAEGRERANKFARDFNSMMSNLELAPDVVALTSVKAIKEKVMNEFYTLIKSHNKNLVGGTSAHSFKTYLLAFDEYLRADAPNDKRMTDFYLKLAAKDTKKAYEAKFPKDVQAEVGFNEYRYLRHYAHKR